MLTNGYPDPEARVAELLEELRDARQQVSWHNKPGDDPRGEWAKAVARIEKELTDMGAEIPENK